MCAHLVQNYALTVGNEKWVEQVRALDVTLTLAPGINRLTAHFPPDAPINPDLGAPVLLDLGNGEREETVFTGEVQTISRAFDGLKLVAVDGGGLLSAIRPTTTFEQVSAGRVIKELAGEAGVSVDAVADGIDLTFYVADPGHTAWEHIARLAGWSGTFARVDADGTLTVFEIGAGTADLALAYGRDLTDLTHRTRSDGALEMRVVGESAAGSTSASEALRPVINVLDGTQPTADRRIIFRPALRTADAAGRASAGGTRAIQATAQRMDLAFWLQPHLRPGQKLELQELPDSLTTGIGWIETVRHRIGPLNGSHGGAETIVQANRDPEGFDPLALLGSLGGALSAVF